MATDGENGEKQPRQDDATRIEWAKDDLRRFAEDGAPLLSNTEEVERLRQSARLVVDAYRGAVTAAEHQRVLAENHKLWDLLGSAAVGLNALRQHSTALSQLSWDTRQSFTRINEVLEEHRRREDAAD
jgi:hypothetical protein